MRPVFFRQFSCFSGCSMRFSAGSFPRKRRQCLLPSSRFGSHQSKNQRDNKEPSHDFLPTLTRSQRLHAESTHSREECNRPDKSLETCLFFFSHLESVAFIGLSAGFSATGLRLRLWRFWADLRMARPVETPRGSGERLL